MVDIDNTSANANHIAKFTGDLFFVDAGMADDTEDGSTPQKAKKTIGAAITACAAGDRLTIKAGTYTETGIDLNKNSVEMFFEIGAIIDPATGTALTISANYCRVTCEGGALRITPATDQTGVLVSGNFCYLNEIRVSCFETDEANSADLGFDITGDGADLRRCRVSSPDVAAFKIQGDKVKLEDCCTGGGTSAAAFASIGYWMTNNCDKSRLNNCGSQGHGTSSFYIDSGCTNPCIRDCSSGVGDGKWRDIDRVATWSDFSFDKIKTSTATLDADAETKSYNVAQITGTVLIKKVHIAVLTALSSNIRNFYLDIWDGATSKPISADTGLTLDSAPAGSLITRSKDSDEVLDYQSGATCFIIENTNFRRPQTEVICGQKGDDTATYLRMTYTTTDSPSSGSLRGHVEWSPITDDGFVEVL